MSDDLHKHVHSKTLTYQEMRELAASDDLAVRCALAERTDLKPEVLYFLAEDDDHEVRRRIAVNPSTPRKADLLLAEDKEETVRLVLTEKVAKLAPGVSPDEQETIEQLTHDALMILSRDQVTKVRQILSETLKDMVDAPGEVINRLARDVEIVVAGPVLQFSPVLSDEDLLEIISSSHPKGALNAISKRKNVSEKISEAVVDKNEESAIADLLANESAQIREDTLDYLAEKAEVVSVWQSPLVRRPKLSLRAAKRMAHYLADNLLASLQERRDLPDDVITSIKEVVARRIEEEDDTPEKETDPIDEIKALHKSGVLSTDMLDDWMTRSRWLHAASCLAVMADMRRVMVKKILSSQSGKGIMALTWKAGLDASWAEPIQIKLAKMPLRDVMKATDKGDFPMTEDELSWHLELFGAD